MLRVFVSNVVGLVGLAGVCYGLTVWVHLGCGLSVTGSILLFLSIRSLSQ